MTNKNDLIRALKIYRERTDDAIAERDRQIGQIKTQLAELYRVVIVDISNVGGLDLLRSEERCTLDGAIVELESLTIALAGNTIAFKPQIVDSSLQVTISNLSPEHPSMTMRKEYGQWIVFSSSDTFLSQFSTDFFLSRLVDLVDGS